MNSRERVKLALSRKEPDRIPFDLGGTILTSIHKDAYRQLREYLGLPQKDIRLMDIIQQIVLVDDDLSEMWGVDVRTVAPRSLSTSEIEVKDMGNYTYFHDEWGIGWRMPKDGGFYYDMFEHPLHDATTIEEIDNYPWPDASHPFRFEGLRERARHVAEVEGKAVMMGCLSAGIQELAAWMRGYDNYFPDFVNNEALLTRLMDKILELKMTYWEKALAVGGEFIDVIQEADDLAGQFKMLISPRTYRKVCKPRHKELFDFIHARTDAKIFFHSCGAMRPIIPDLIEMGVDILNPIQVSSSGMDTAELKREFGKDLTFWGGGVDTQHVLGDGTPQQVCDEVKRRIEDLAPDGGFIFATVHNIQANVPPENLVAMWEALQEHNTY